MPRLLLADDSVTIQRVIELTFADEAIEVISVGDGRSAIEQIQQQPPDIVLADIGMPERDGYEVAAFVKGTPELSSIPVLLLTGAFEPIDEDRARAVGCDGVLVKPFEPQMVISRVKDLLGGRRPDGMWAAPAPQSPLRQSAPVADAQLSVAASAGSGGGLEDYFDRLDAAFASLESGEMKLSSLPGLPAAPQVEPHPAPQSDSDDLAQDLAAWTMQEDVEPAPSATDWEQEQKPPAERASEPQHVAHVPAPEAPRTAPPTLAEAFAALLAAEQAQPFAPAAINPAPVPVVQAAPPPEPVPEHVVEAIVERVVARMTDQAVRQTVLDVAERVVREEIDRIKSSHPQV